MEIKKLTPAVERILRMAEIEASRDDLFIGVNHVMIAMMLEGKNFGALTLANAGFTIDALRQGEGPNARG